MPLLAGPVKEDASWQFCLQHELMIGVEPRSRRGVSYITRFLMFACLSSLVVLCYCPVRGRMVMAIWLKTYVTIVGNRREEKLGEGGRFKGSALNPQKRDSKLTFLQELFLAHSG